MNIKVKNIFIGLQIHVHIVLKSQNQIEIKIITKINLFPSIISKTFDFQSGKERQSGA